LHKAQKTDREQPHTLLHSVVKQQAKIIRHNMGQIDMENDNMQQLSYGIHL